MAPDQSEGVCRELVQRQALIHLEFAAQMAAPLDLGLVDRRK